MPSTQNPFPGMNPWLQRKWSDVHTMLIGYIRDGLSLELPGELAAYAEERVALQTEEGKATGYRSDVAITESWRNGLPPVWTPDHDRSPIAVATPLLIHTPPRVERWVEIVDPEDRLITVIEILSPFNKSAEGRHAYITKTNAYLNAGIGLVEIDLVRGGYHSIQCPPSLMPELEGTPYYFCVNRGTAPDRRELYPCPLREPLPAIRIPLRPTDADIPLDLQPLIDRVYELGRYWRSKWEEPLNPPLSEEDAGWAKERLTAAGLLA